MTVKSVKMVLPMNVIKRRTRMMKRKRTMIIMKKCFGEPLSRPELLEQELRVGKEQKLWVDKDKGLNKDKELAHKSIRKRNQSGFLHIPIRSF